MAILKRISTIIDQMNDWIGKIMSWSVIVTMLLIVFEVTSRWVFNSPTIWGLEVITMVFGMHFMMVAAYALLHESLVRVDLFHRKFSERNRVILDILTYLLFFFPFVIIILYVSTEYALDSWIEKERASSVFSPPIYPFKTVIPVAFLFLLLQGVSELSKRIYTLLRRNQE